MLIKFISEETGEEVLHEVPSVKGVCDDCGGEGFVLNESMRDYAYSMEEFMEEFDYEERQQYFQRGGMYDVPCPTCKGKNVIDVINREACERDSDLKKVLAQYDDYLRREAEYERICALNSNQIKAARGDHIRVSDMIGIVVGYEYTVWGSEMKPTALILA